MPNMAVGSIQVPLGSSNMAVGLPNAPVDFF